mmetsp:Transcript_27927/g.62321  ORF Transcript_27927/g.62321 Transcript_27927/m.62321 type:complete len:680 (+) Transcript_27927:108-2147(+)|eukprot:CAMPEP_0172628184 /NCGR_PEP_ID=MMETSP1068-20121228/160287_1 /TAXON_ID=35684 /ORGANISM="Pseudopedinella elastica, Strain CCMP716" /LENGTH=679 /DNA_ID=CAMNT_0013438285 /DNA_START=102 /DNA_END=2141 /DNA_ORIENTATION=+
MYFDRVFLTAAFSGGAVVLLSYYAQLHLWVMGPLGFIAVFMLWVSRWPARDICLKAVPASVFLPENLPKDIDTIVIGSGIGGCTAANLLAQSGKKVLVLEQHPRTTGGCTHSFKHEGCEWDTGLHYTSKDMAIRTARSGAIMDFMARGRQEWTELGDPYDEITFPRDDHVKPGSPNVTSYTFVTGVENTVEGIMAKIDPSNLELKKRAHVYMKLCLEINDGFTALGILRVLPTWLHFLVSKRTQRLYKFASMTVRDVQYALFNLGYDPEQLLKSCPKAPYGPEPDPSIRRLKAVLTHPIGDYAVQPREASMAAHGVTMAHYSRGGGYTVGPTQNISLRVLSMVREFGGEVILDASVREIIIEDGKAVGVRVGSTTEMAARVSTHVEASSSLTEVRAKNIVWASGIYNLYNQVLPQNLPQVRDFHDPIKRTVRPSNGHIYLFCKILGDAHMINLPTHNLWWFNSYDLDEAFDKYFASPTSVRPPTVYLGFPCTKDTTWPQRFPGVSNCVLISDGLWEWFEDWEDRPLHNRGKEYEDFKKRLSDILLEVLYEMVPQTRGKVEVQMLATPLSDVAYLASFQGGSYGTKCEPEMFAKINRKWTTTPRTAIPGLYLAGSDAFLPSVVGAMHGGCFGAIAVLGHMRTLRLVWAFLGHFAASVKKESPALSWPRAYFLAAKKCVYD